MVRLALLSISVLAVCSAPGQVSSDKKFSWDWRKAEGLSYRQDLRNQHIPELQRTRIKLAILEHVEETTQDEALDTPVKFVDLNHDGSPEVVAQGPRSHCSATGNCPFAVFRKDKDGGYSLILKSFGQTFTVQARRNSFSDVIVGMHGSAYHTALFVFRYNKTGYRRVGCYDARWDWTGESPGAEDKEPQITPCARPRR